MDFFDVLDRLPDAIGMWLLVGVVAATFYGYYRVFRTQITSVFDPLGMVLVFSSFATTFLIILALVGFVESWALAFGAATLALFYAPLLVLGERGAARRPGLKKLIGAPTTGSLLILLGFQLLLQGIIYVAVGIPLLEESRLTLYAGGSGLGLLGRLKDGLELASVVLPFVALRCRFGSRLIPWLLIVAVAVGALLSGSKGEILVLPFGWYLAAVYVEGRWRVSFNLTKRRFVALIVLVMVPISVTLSRASGGSFDVIQSVRDVAVRLVAEGDGYAYFFGGNRIEDIARHDVLALVRPITTALRITDPSAAVTPGFEIVRDLLGSDDADWGPNTRLPIFILYFYGVPGLLLAPILGVCLVVARNTTLRKARGSSASFALACSAYAALARTEVDPQIMVNGLFNVLLAAPLLYGAMSVCQHRPRPARNADFRALSRLAR